MQQFDVVTIGSALKDIIFFSDDVFVVNNKKNINMPKLLAMPYGAKLPIKDVFVNYGGGAMNVAIGLKNFGIDVAPIVSVGHDQVGLEFFHYLKVNNIPSNFVNIDKMHKTGFSLVINAAKDKEHTVFTYRGASNDLIIPNLRLFRTKWLYVSSLNGKDWAKEFEKVAHQTKRNVRVAWNPGDRQLSDHKNMLKFLPYIEILILNKDEAMQLVSKAAPRTSRKLIVDSRFLLKKLKSFGSDKVVITQGAKGVVALDNNGTSYSYPSQSIARRIVETVGAGDAFSSGLLAGMVRWEDFGKSLRLGIRNSAQVLCRVGAQTGLLKIKIR